jgi:tetratricopeptide (TPR) repeat protein
VLALVVGVAIVLWWPVYHRTCLTVAMQQAYSRQQWEPVAELASQAARADVLDPMAAADAARAYGLLPPGQSNLSAAYEWANEAIRRDGQAAAWQQLASVISWRLEPSRAIAHMEQAVKLDPQDLRLRLQYADMLAQTSQPAAALRELEAVETIDLGLLRDSSERLNFVERGQIRKLRQTIAGSDSRH